MIRFLQDNVVAIHDHAWGDGELFAEYRCRPGTPVDFYQDGSKWNVLISLRETKNRGDELDLRVEREIEDGLTQSSEWMETEVDHLMRHLRLSIIFPKARRCRRAVVVRRTTSQTLPLGEKHFAYLGALPAGRAGGRQFLGSAWGLLARSSMGIHCEAGSPESDSRH